ncbi:molecular chaperone [Coemansia sp. RSA 2618]|nr:molecular chaperone [Coemansia sp. RSA 2618]
MHRRLYSGTRIPGGAGGSATRTCWRCQYETSQTSVLCENTECAAIQSVSATATYYDVLVGAPPAFTVDLAQLRRNFLRLQQAVHPDSFTQRADVERRLADAQSAWINHAYATLRDPLLRAHYMLELQGRGIGEEDQRADPELLGEIMEMREEIEAAETEAQIAELKQGNDEKAAATERALAEAFEAGDVEGAQHLTRRLQFLRRVAQAIQGWEPGKPIVVSH